MANEPVNYDAESFDTKMKSYYDRIFPYEPMYQWLSYGHSDATTSEVFARREFSFTLADDIYIRYLSYSNWSDWKKDMREKVPHKIDMGAVYNAPPKDKSFLSKDGFKEVSREFVLDIDLTDYQDDGTIRTNCIDPGDEEFRKSWRFMAVACKVLDRALREDFGFKHLLWVFSGRRGIHCWVSDERARNMSNATRTAVAEYLNIFKGGDKEKTKNPALSSNLHPSLERSLGVLEGEFKAMLEEQGWLESKERWDKILDLFDDDDFSIHMDEKFANKGKKMSSDEKWKLLETEFRKYKSHKVKRDWPEVSKHILFTLMYPRLDINVSKMQNHLLKSPFCVHPKTHRVCVPIDPEKIDDFDPYEVPTLEDALRELDDAKLGKKTAFPMQSFVKTFKLAYLSDLLKDYGRQKRKAAEADMTF